MRKGIVTPERNTGNKLTIPVKTRSPIEAFKLLRQGQPIDRIAGYYEKEGLITKDFHFMDHIEKLHMLAEVRSLMDRSKTEIEAVTADYINNQNKLKDEQNSQAEQQRKEAEDRKPGGTVSEPGQNGRPTPSGGT